MAKKAPSQSTVSAKAKESVPSNSAIAPSLTSETIGRTAGEVWQALREEGPQSLTALKKVIHAPGDQVVAALGWLAREGKLEFAMKGRTMQVTLRD